MTDDNTDEHGARDLPTEDWVPEPERIAIPDAEGPHQGQQFQDVGPKRRRSRRKMITSIVVVVALVGAGTAAWLLLGAEKNSSDDADDVPAVIDTSPESGSAAPNGSSPTDTLEFPTLGLFDSFAREDSDDLGFTASGPEWTEVAGEWSIESRSAVVSQPNPDGPSIAVANTRATRSVVQVTMPSVERGAGLVFRYTNQFNYWALTAAPNSGTWVVSQVTQGESAVVKNLGLAQVDDNTTIAVRSDENSMEIFVDGKRATTIVAPAPPRGTYAGLIGSGPGTVDARWVNFVAIALE